MSGGATGEVLQEYLVKLGYTTDLISLRKFEDSLGNTGKKVFKIGAGVAGVVASVEAAAAAFAYSMRKTYFAAELADTSVKSMQAMTYAGKQFGISGDSMASSIKGMAQAMRLNPGLQGLVESFGIKVQGRDTSDVMTDFVKAIKDMPEFVGQQYAGMFGMDADTFHQVRNHYDEIIAKRNELTRMQKEAGFDVDAQKKNILEYTAAMDKLSARFDIFASTFLSAMGPVFKGTTDWLDHIIEGWTYIFADKDQKAAMLKKRSTPAPVAPSTPTGEDPRAIHERIMRGEQVGTPLKRGAAGVSGGATTLAALEAQYGLPAGLLDRVWAQESGRGRNMRSAAGAKGHFQFMDKTAKQFGVNDPDNFEESAQGAAKMYSYLHKKYGGNTSLALAAYNWGEGNVDSYLKTGKGLKGQAMPNETKDYVNKILGGDTRLGSLGGSGVTQNNTTTINVTGNGAEATARAVGKEQTRVLGDATRMLKGATG